MFLGEEELDGVKLERDVELDGDGATNEDTLT